jgi:Tfp pilus assembly PilM family ATPase
MRFPPSPAGRIGVDVSGRWLKAAQFRGGRGAPVLHAGARVPRPGGTGGPVTAPEVEYLSGVLERRGFARAPLAIAAPREAVACSALELPPAGSGAPLDQITRLELARVARCEPGVLVTGMWALPAPTRGAGSTHVMGVGLAIDQAETLLAPFDAAGLEVEAIDIRECGLVRGCGAVGGGPGLRCILDVGWDGTTLVLTMNGAILFTRTLEMAGLSRLAQVVEQRLDVDGAALTAVLDDPGREGAADIIEEMGPTLGDFAEALSPEVGRSLAYVTQRHPEASLSGAALCGEGAGLPGLVEHLQGQFPVGWRIVRPGEVAALPGSLQRLAHDSGLVCAMGLARPGQAEGRAAA